MDPMGIQLSGLIYRVERVAPEGKILAKICMASCVPVIDVYPLCFSSG